MAGERIEGQLGLDTAQFQQALQAIETILTKYNATLDSTAKMTVQVNKQNDIALVTFKALTKEGNTLESGIKRTTLGFQELAKSITEVSDTATKLRAAQITESVTTRFKPNFTGATQEEINAYNKAISGVVSQGVGSDLSTNQISNALTKLAAGVKVLKPEYQDLADATLRLKAAQESLGSSTRTQIQDLERLKNAIATANKVVPTFFAGKISTSATPQELNKVAIAVGKFADTLIKTGMSEVKAFELINQAVKGNVSVLQGSSREIIASFNAVSAAVTATGKGVRQGQINIANTAKEHADRVKQFLNRTASLLANQVIWGTFARIKTFTQDSIEFSKSIAEIGTLTQAAGVHTETWARGLNNLSSSFGLTRKDVAEGLYETLSNQIASGTNALSFMGEAAKFAVVSQTSLTDSVNLLSSAINAYGYNQSETNQIASQFYKIIDLGRLRAKDIANTFGTVAIITSEAGVSFEEVGAVLTTLTRQGVTAANAQTYLRNLINQTIKPTKEMTETLKKYGFTTGEEALKVKGLVGWMGILKNEIDGNVAKTGELFTNIRSLLAALNLTGRGFNTFVSDFEQIRNAPSGYDKKVQDVMNSAGKQTEIAITTLANDFKKITDEAIKAFALLTKEIGGVGNVILSLIQLMSLYYTFKHAAKIIEIANAWGALTVATKANSAATAANLPIQQAAATRLNIVGMAARTLIAAYAAVSVELLLLKQYQDETNAQWNESIEKLASKTKAINGLIVEDTKKFAEEQARIYLDLSSQITAVLLQGQNSIREQYEITYKQTTDVMKRLTQAFEDHKRDLERENDKVVRYRANYEKEVSDYRINTEKTAFQLSLQNLTIASKRAALEKQTAFYLAQAGKEAVAGNVDGVRRYFEAVRDVQKQIAEVNKAIEEVNDQEAAYIEQSAQRTVDFMDKIMENFFKVVDKNLGQLQKAINSKLPTTSQRELLREWRDALRFLNAPTRRTFTPFRIDPETMKLLESMSPKARRDLKWNITIGNKDAVDQVVNSIKEAGEIAKREDKANRTRIEAEKALQRGLAAGELNRFEEQRQSYQKAIDLYKELYDMQNAPAALQRIQEIDAAYRSTFEKQKAVLGEIASKNKEQEEQKQKEIEAQRTLNQLAEDYYTVQLLMVQIAELEKADREKQIVDIETQKTTIAGIGERFKQLKKIQEDGSLPLDEMLTRYGELLAELDNINPTNQLTITLLQQQKLLMLDQVNAVERMLALETKVVEQRKLGQQVEQQKAAKNTLLGALKEQSDAAIETNKQFKLTDRYKEIKNEMIKLGQERDAIMKRVKDQQSGIFFPGQDIYIDSLNQKLKTLQETLNGYSRRAQNFDAIFQGFKASLVPDAQGNFLPPDLTPEQLKELERIIAQLKKDKKIPIGVTDDQLLNPLIEAESLMKQMQEDAAKQLEITVKTDRAIPPLQELIDKLKELKLTIPQIKITTSIQSLEGAKGFATGGLVTGPSGNDRVAARLTSGEFVMNRDSTSRFYDQLQMMNSRPSQVGGSTTHVGGINVTVQGTGYAEKDAMEIAKSLRRLVKRGQVSLS